MTVSASEASDDDDDFSQYAPGHMPVPDFEALARDIQNRASHRVGAATTEMCDKEDRKEQRKKKKKRQKKKRAKKRVKKATRAALEDQDDHGGKVGPGTADGYNSSSSRSSSISSNSSGDDSTV